MTYADIFAISAQLDQTAGDLAVCSTQLREIAEELAAQNNNGAPPWTDIRARLPVNHAPDEEWLVAHGITDWWERTPDRIDGITIHHVCSNGDPYNTAAYITRSKAQGGKGLPRMQYHYWIESTGEILYCLDVKYGSWHDNCGHYNTHVSVVLNGALHKYYPTQAALVSAARLSAWLMREYNITRDNITGHNEWAMRCLNRTKPYTQCPGWSSIPWKDSFYTALDEALQVPSSAVSYGLVSSGSLSAEELQELNDAGRV